MFNQTVPPEYRQLLETILYGTPRLPGALCVGFSDIFDAPTEFDDDVRERVRFAVHRCHCCPALIDRARWVNSLPRDGKPLGVTAGVLRRSYQTRDVETVTVQRASSTRC